MWKENQFYGGKKPRINHELSLSVIEYFFKNCYKKNPEKIITVIVITESALYLYYDPDCN